MKPKEHTYILFVFATCEDPDKLVSVIGEEISLISMSDNVRYFYGPQSSVFTFTSVSTFEEISELLTIMFSDYDFTYMFLPLDKNKMCSGFGKEVDKHLFGPAPLTIIPTSISKINRIKEELENYADDEEDDEIDDELEKIKFQSYEPSVNDILDKIQESGIKSLTKTEKNILDNYAKQL